MRIKRKPLLLNAWHNSKGARPGGKPAEPMPPWVKSLAEKSAAPDTTFVLNTPQGKKIVRADDIVYQSPDGSVHSIRMERFKQEYDLVDLQPNKSVPPNPGDVAV